MPGPHHRTQRDHDQHIEPIHPAPPPARGITADVHLRGDRFARRGKLEPVPAAGTDMTRLGLRPRLRVTAAGLARAGWSGLSGAVMALGVLLASAGLLLTLTATSADAAAVSCNGSLVSSSLLPGDSGTCTLSYSETAAQLGNPFTVTVNVHASSASGSGTVGSGTATEALLDGTATSLQVAITDSAGNTFGLGASSCSGTYPDAASCSSSDLDQAVPGMLDTSSWSDTFTITWSLPLAAGNPYQGGNATVTVTPYYNGTPAPSPSPSPGGGVLGISFSPSPSGGVLGASTPSTGAGPTSTASLVLIALGMVLLLIGASGVGWASRSRRRIP